MEGREGARARRERQKEMSRIGRREKTCSRLPFQLTVRVVLDLVPGGQAGQVDDVGPAPDGEGAA